MPAPARSTAAAAHATSGSRQIGSSDLDYVQAGPEHRGAEGSSTTLTSADLVAGADEGTEHTHGGNAQGSGRLAVRACGMATVCDAAIAGPTADIASMPSLHVSSDDVSTKAGPRLLAGSTSSFVQLDCGALSESSDTSHSPKCLHGPSAVRAPVIHKRPPMNARETCACVPVLGCYVAFPGLPPRNYT